MKAQPAGLLLHLGLMSPFFTGLVVLAACLAGGWAISSLITPHRRPVVEIIEVPIVVTEGAAKYPTTTDMTVAPGRESLVAPQSWAFESASDAPVQSAAKTTARKRADLLSGPEGWTYASE
jgi:hypothetical protein